MELWQFSFIRDWPEIQKSQIPPSEFCPIYGEWGKLWILNFARMSLIECYWMLQNSRVTAFTTIELLRETQLGGGGNYPPPPATQNRVKVHSMWNGPNFRKVPTWHTWYCWDFVKSTYPSRNENSENFIFFLWKVPKLQPPKLWTL